MFLQEAFADMIRRVCFKTNAHNVLRGTARSSGKDWSDSSFHKITFIYQNRVHRQTCAATYTVYGKHRKACLIEHTYKH